MTDTRKEFERAVSNLGWAFDYIGDGQYGSHTIQFANKLWHACQSLNDKRIEQFLAVIAKKDESLIKACELIEKFSLQVYNGSDCLKVYDAVELQPADVELVDASNISDDEWNKYKSTGEGIKFYIIKTKADKK